MAHIVLVHGICHGAWCWYKVVSLLKSSDHHVSALDLAGCGVHRSRLEEVVSFSDYVQPLMDLLQSLPADEKVVLVGHSYGRLVVSMAMERFPEKIAVDVFVSSYMPDLKGPPATTVLEFFNKAFVDTFIDCQLKFGKGPRNPPTSTILGQKFMSMKAYKHCQHQDLELAKMLVRPSGLFIEDI